MKKYIIYIIIFLLGVIGATYFTKLFDFNQKVKEENISVVLNKIEKVFKLVTVEANLAEIYDYKDYYTFDFSPFRKKALIRVNARVSAGYDFEKVKFTSDEKTKTIIIENFPQAEILSIDHDLDYYDITQGTFNSFTKEDYNEINKKAKAFISSKALDNKVLDEAAAQKDEIIEMLRFLIENTGWTLEIQEQRFLD